MTYIYLLILIAVILRSRLHSNGFITVLWSFGRDGAVLFEAELWRAGGAIDEYTAYLAGSGSNLMGGTKNSTPALGLFLPSGYCVLGVATWTPGIIWLNRFVGFWKYDEYYLERRRGWIQSGVGV